MIGARSVLICLLSLIAVSRALRRNPNWWKARLRRPLQRNAVAERFRFETYDTMAQRVSGISFPQVWQSHLRRFGLMESIPFSAIPVNVSSWRPVFLTSSSSNHFNELKSMVLHIHTTQPSASIVVYDLGLTNNEIAEIKSWCRVTYRKFDFKRYPVHVRQLKKYAWKFLVIAEELVRLKSFFYIDTSIRPHYGDLSVFPRDARAGKIEPFFLFSGTLHSVYAATHPGMYRYFPLSPWIGKQLEMLQSGLMFIQDSPYARRVLKWTTLCSLTENCIAPKGAQLSCEYYRDLFLDYLNCHRYDQSEVNLIIANFLFNERRMFNWAGDRPLAALKKGKPQKSMVQSHLKAVIAKWKNRARHYEQHFSVMRDMQYWGAINSCPESSMDSREMEVIPFDAGDDKDLI